MKREKLFSFFWAWVLSLCLGLGAVGSLATGLELPVSLPLLVLYCALAALIVSGCLSFRYGIWVPLALAGALCFRRSLWVQLRTVAAAVMDRITRGYGIPTPELLLGEPSETVLLALVVIGGAVIFFCSLTVLKRTTGLIAAAAASIPLCGCITVVDTVPDSLWVFLWCTGLVLLLMTQTCRRQQERRGNRLTAALAVPVVAVMLLLFWLIPRDAQDRWSIGELPSQILSYFTQGNQGSGSVAAPLPPRKTVDLSDLGQLNLRQTPVMEVTADFSGTLYLRSRDFDSYSGTQWNSTGGRTEILSTSLTEPRGIVRIKTRSPEGHYYLPGYQSGAYELTDGYCPNPDRVTEYVLPCGALSGALPPINPITPNNQDELLYLAPYLRLPYDTAEKVVHYLQTQGTDRFYGTASTVNYVRELVSGLAPYDLNAPKMPPEETDLAVWFLEQGERGYCVHFASTAAVLLRTMNIPARYVEGYMVDVEANKTVTVRESHAHAWVEYYQQNVGWIILEATPAASVSDTPEETTSAEETEPSDTEPSAQSTAPQATEPISPSAPSRDTGSFSLGFLQYVIPVLGAGLLLWLQYLLRRRLLRNRLRKGKPNQRALVLYRQITRLCRRLKLPVPPEVTALAQKARFGHNQLTAPELLVLRTRMNELETSAREAPLLRKIITKWFFALS